MTIQEIKERLSIDQVLSHYGINIERNGHIQCPFHDDKKASMKVYKETNTAYCFAGSCPTQEHSVDVIDFIMHMENCSKHDAILKAKSMAGHLEKPKPVKAKAKTPKTNGSLTLENVFASFRKGIYQTQKAQAYVMDRGLDYQQLEIGYNSGQMHHRKPKAYLEGLEALQVIKPYEKGGYSIFAKDCLIFPLKDQAGRICSLYGRKITKPGHYYLTGRSGLYPSYPAKSTKKILLTESIIDAASLLQLSEVTSEYFVLALFGTNGLTGEHKAALSGLEELEQVVIMLDGDDAGKAATSKVEKELYELFLSIEKSVEIKKVYLPDGTDVNELWANHKEPQLFLDLLPIETSRATHGPEPQLDKSDLTNLRYNGRAATYWVKGFKSSKGLDSLNIRLMAENKNGIKYGAKIELYDDESVERYAGRASRKLGVHELDMQLDLSKLTDLMEAHRRDLLIAKEQAKRAGMKDRKPKLLTADEKQAAIKFWKQKHLLKTLNECIGKTGVIGERSTRLLLLLCALSYKLDTPLHVLIQGSSGSGKTLLLRKITNLIPEEDRFIYTSLTPKNLYYRDKELMHAYFAIEDWDGLPEEIRYALRELQLGKVLRRGSSKQLDSGDFCSVDVVTYGPIASAMCTTSGEIYEDNMNRCFLITVNEGKEQTNAILDYQAACKRGEVNKLAERDLVEVLQNAIRLLRKAEVINPYAGKVNLPEDIPNQRRLNDLFLNLINLIAWIHQYQRQKDSQNRIIAEPKDIEAACQLLLGTLVQKADDLNSKLRGFFERLKDYVLQQGGENHRFKRKDIRLGLRMSKSSSQRFFEELEELEYIRPVQGSKYTGFIYEICFWDDYLAFKAKIENSIKNQLKEL